MNVREKPFTDVKVRQAVNYAINTARIQKLLAGQAKALNQIYPDGMPGYQADKQFYTYDPAKAKQLLAEAGFPNGFKVTFVRAQRRPVPQAGAGRAERPQGRRHRRQHQAHGQGHLLGLHQPATVARGHRPDRLVPGLPRPERLHRPAVHAPDRGRRRTRTSTPTPRSRRCTRRPNTELDPAKRIEMFVQMQDIIMGDAPAAHPVPAGVQRRCSARTSAATTTTRCGTSSSRSTGSSTASEAMTVARRKASRRDDG